MGPTLTNRYFRCGGYTAAHQRVTRARGPVSGFNCVDCGAPARHWALNHEALLPNLRVDMHTTLAGHVFSLREEDYLPKCARCNHADGEYPRKSTLLDEGFTTAGVS